MEATHTWRYNEFNHGTNFVRSAKHRSGARGYLHNEIASVGFARDVIILYGCIQQLWPAQKLFSVFVEFLDSRTVQHLSDIDYMARYTPLLHHCDWKKRVFGELQQSMFTNIRAQHRSKPCFALYCYCEYVGPILQPQLLNVYRS